jgi:hypothetical protein
MEGIRTIREEEKQLIRFLLNKLNLTEDNYPIGEMVHEYEGGVMGSISFELTENHQYGGDLIQVSYIDTDEIPVVITLTHSIDNKLLDLDFWKEDFSKLIRYPQPGDLGPA